MNRKEKLNLDFKNKCNELKIAKALFKKLFDNINSGIAIYENTVINK